MENRTIFLGNDTVIVTENTDGEMYNRNFKTEYGGIGMNEKLKRVEKTFLEEREINLGKQCKGEYIIYNFYNLTTDNSTVKRMCKEHYSDSSLNELKKYSKHTLLNKSLREVIDNDVYSLLLRGYDLVFIE